MEVIKKHRGTSFVELAIAMSILLVVISISIVRVNRDSLVFDSTVTRVKTDIRRIIVIIESVKSVENKLKVRHTKFLGLFKNCG